LKSGESAVASVGMLTFFLNLIASRYLYLYAVEVRTTGECGPDREPAGFRCAVPE
jgi:hypothetical protein